MYLAVFTRAWGIETDADEDKGESEDVKEEEDDDEEEEDDDDEDWYSCKIKRHLLRKLKEADDSETN